MDYVRIYTDNPSPKEIERVAAVLRDGGIIVYPTDTLYAIGCDALNVRAVERICRLKNIDTRKALLSIVCPDLSMLSQYAKVSNAHFKLMRRNLPGAFTFILPTSSQLPHIYKNRKTVGIRVPDNAIALAITPQIFLSMEEQADTYRRPSSIAAGKHPKSHGKGKVNSSGSPTSGINHKK